MEVGFIAEKPKANDNEAAGELAGGRSLRLRD